MIRSLQFLLITLILNTSSAVYSQEDLEGRYEMFQVTEGSFKTNFLRNLGGPGFLPEWSSNLQAWHGSGETVDGLTVNIFQKVVGTVDGVETVEIAATLDGSTKDGFYLRLRIADDPPAPEGFVYIRAGTFAMGSPAGEATRLINEAQHQVTLSQPFFIATTETIWSEWDRVRDWAVDNGYFQLSLAGQRGSIGSTGENQPVTTVTWYETVSWCNARSEQEGKTPVYYSSASFGSENVFRGGTTSAKVYADWKANGYRLPTEAEWEYSCRAGTTTPLFTGTISFLEDTPLDPNTDRAGWYAGNSQSSTQPVAGKQANAWGLYDTHGNVQEYCWDLYHPDYGGDATDPRGSAPDSGRTLRITRGGSYQGYAQHLRSAHRDFFTGPAASTEFSGFRLVLNSGD